MAGRSLVMTKKVMDTIDDATGFKLKVPEDAARNGSGDPANTKFTWTEPFVIADATHGIDEKNKEWDLIKVTFKVPADAQDTVNAGRTYPVWYRANVDAFGDPNHKDAQMTNINCNRLKSLATAAGFEIAEGDDLFAVFDAQGPGELAQIVGAKVTAKIQQKPGKDKSTGEDVIRQEPIAFYPEVG